MCHEGDEARATPTPSGTAKVLGLISKSSALRLQLLATGVQSCRTLLLDGPTGSGKTYLVEQFAALSGRQLVKIHMTADTGEGPLT